MESGSRAAAGDVGLVDVRDAAATLGDLDAFVRAAGFLSLERYPWPGHGRHVYDDAGNLVRFVLRRSNAWRASAVASAYARHLARRRPDLALLREAFMLAQPVRASDLHAAATGARCERWRDAGLLVQRGDEYISAVRATPWHGQLFWHDAPPGFRESWVFLGADSLRLARQLDRALARASRKRALDIGTGAGIQATMLAGFSERVVGVDINPRAVAYAGLNAELNGAGNVEVRTSDLYEAVAGERFDLIVSNPPFLFLPPEWRARCVDGDGGALGIALTLRIIDGLATHLASDGRAIVQTNSPIVDGRDVLVDELRRRLGHEPWRVRLTAIHEFQDAAFYEFYASHRIERFVAYLIDIERADRFTLTRRPMPPWRRAACALRIAAVRAGQRRRTTGSR